MCQPRGAVAGGLIQDLDNCSVMAVDCEDRRYCFQISTPSGKPYASYLIWEDSVHSTLARAASSVPKGQSSPGEATFQFLFFQRMVFGSL